MNLNKENLINKIIYRSQYRGTKEMDLFVSSFVKSVINTLEINELNDLNYIINLSDEDIMKISNKKNIKSKIKKGKVLDLLVNFNKNY
tara:strand:- start:43 stop:306 length:264 start_codon:yes stop_codon:yes gene_type:complete